MQAAKASSSSSSSSPPSLSCQRCSQPLQLDESLSDEALLASAASSSSNEGALTTSNYDVISSLVSQGTTAAAAADRELAKQTTPLKNVKDAELREAVLQHHQREHRHTKDDLRAGQAAGAAPNSLTARLSLHSRLFDLVSSFVPAGSTATAPPASSSSSASSSSHQHHPSSGATVTAAAGGPRSFPLGIDHPLCLDCSDYCLEVIRRQVEEVRKERDALSEFNRELERSTTGNDGGAEESGKARRRIDGEAEVARLETEIVELQTAVDEAVAALYKSERTRRELEEELRQLELEERELEADEADFWAGHSQLLSETTALESTKSSLQRSLQVSETTLARLNSTNVFYDAFCIGHEGGGGPPSASSSSSSRKRATGTGLATINGLRFGKMSSSSSGGGATSVEWNEVNAAWGQVALLVEVLRGRIGGMLEGQTARGNLSTPGRKGREFVGWRVRPKGSTSAMEKLAHSGQHPAATSSASPFGHQSEEIYELYHPGPWAGVTRMLHSRRFDAAMIGILDCTSQLFQWAEKVSASSSSSSSTSTTNSSGAGGGASSAPPRMIHAINGEKIGDTSIRLAGAFFASEETWSRATKYLLVNLQVLMHWATRNETVPVPAPIQA